MKMLMASGYRFPTNNQVTRSISKADATAAVGTCQIHVLGPGPQGLDGVQQNSAQYLETWSLTNPWIKSVSMGDLDYGSDDLLTMDVTLRYDWASLQIPVANGIYDPSTQFVDPETPVSPEGLPALKRLKAKKSQFVDQVNSGQFGPSGG